MIDLSNVISWASSVIFGTEVSADPSDRLGGNSDNTLFVETSKYLYNVSAKFDVWRGLRCAVKSSGAGHEAHGRR